MGFQDQHVQVTRRNFVRGVGLLSASAALAACSQQSAGSGQSAAPAASPLLAIIHTNDTHGHDVEVASSDNVDGNFSMAAVPALRAEWEKKGYEVIVVDAGDATQGMPLVDTTAGGSAMAFMNSCGYDLMAVGNHEFDWGTQSLQENREQAKFPWLSANVVSKDKNEPVFEQNKVIELTDGTKVGFFGLTTASTLTTTSPKNIADFTFLDGEDLYARAKEQVEALRAQGCGLVVCIGHLGNEEWGGATTSKEVLKNVDGIDLFIDGHDHKEVEEDVSGALLVETGCYLHNIGVVVIDDGVPKNDPVAYGSFEGKDAATQKIIEDENARMEEIYGIVLGATPFFLDGNRDPGVRTQETNLGDFVTDSFRWTASRELGSEVDASVVNGGAIRASVEAGDITLKVIKEIMPYSNELTVLKVSGAQLLEALEAACQGLGGEDALGAFPQVSGMSFTVDLSIPYDAGPNYPDSTFASPAAPGARVSISEVGGRAFSENEVYTVACSSFLCQGGDTYHAFKDAADAEQPITFGFDYEAAVSYLVEGCDHTVPDSYATPQGRITILS